MRNVDEPLIMERGGQSYYYLADGLGSIVKLVDASGATVNDYTYDVFGNIMERTEGVPNMFTYTAREYDMELDLYYYRARYYDPRIGRFLSEDPIGFAGGMNFYTYVGNNPINYTDPWGLSPNDWWNPRFYINFWSNFAGGTYVFYLNYKNMRLANTIGADKYFHCMANCQAAKRGFGGIESAIVISEGRELFDEYLKRDPRSACDEDRKANRLGRGGNPLTGCQ